MALWAWASLARLDKLKLIPLWACFSLLWGRQPGQSLRVTKTMKLDLRCSSTECVILVERYASRWRRGGGQ